MAAMSALAEKEETQVGATQQLLSQDKKRSTWPSLGQWVSCICVVTFDLELGQAIEVQRELPTPHTHTPVRMACTSWSIPIRSLSWGKFFKVTYFDESVRTYCPQTFEMAKLQE